MPVVVTTVLLALVAGAYGGGVEQALDPYGFEDPAEERVRAERVLERATGVDPEPQVVVLIRGGDVRRVERLLRKDRAVARVVSSQDRPMPRGDAPDDRSRFLLVYMRAMNEGDQQDAAVRLQQSAGQLEGVTLGGEAVANAEIEATIEQDLQRAELIAFPIVLLLSFLFFRGLVAALLPPLVGLLTILGTFALLRLLSEAMELSVFSLNLVTGLGLGLAIDYTLMLTSRYREEIAERGPGPAALLGTLQTAGRAVLFSALTVAGALAALLIFPQRFLFSMGVGGVLVPLLAATITLVVLPAVLALLGERVNAGAPSALRRLAEREARPTEHGAWYRLARFVMRHPVAIAATSAVALLAAAAPALEARFTQLDARVLPTGTDARAVSDAIERVGVGGQSPMTVVVRSERRTPVSQLAARVERLDGVAHTAPPERVGPRLWQLDVQSRDDPLSSSSQRLVERIRALDSPAQFLVGGESAAQIDQKESIGKHMPIALLLLVLVTVLVLFVMTRAIVLAVKQVVMSALVVGAAFGISVFVFQDGRLEGLLGYQSHGALELAQPVLIAALVFALSTDYGVFLFSRIVEARDAGEPNDRAVALGLERTGRIVTAAAVLFCVAIGATATSEISYIKQLGIAVAAAVLIDAFVVRALLVPSLMRLLGRFNWWLPAPFARLQRARQAAPERPRR